MSIEGGEAFYRTGATPTVAWRWNCWGMAGSGM
jgi:hypothetical protein